MCFFVTSNPQNASTPPCPPTLPNRILPPLNPETLRRHGLQLAVSGNFGQWWVSPSGATFLIGRLAQETQTEPQETPSMPEESIPPGRGVRLLEDQLRVTPGTVPPNTVPPPERPPIRLLEEQLIPPDVESPEELRRRILGF